MLKRAFPLVSSKRGDLVPRYTLTCYKLYNKHTYTYSTRTHKQTRGVKGKSLLGN